MKLIYIKKALISLSCILFVTAVNAQSVSESASTPYEDAANVMSFYSDTYTSTVGFTLQDWGQATSVSYVALSNSDEVMQYDYYDYVPYAPESSVDLGGMSYYHIDVWTSGNYESEFYVQIADVNGGYDNVTIGELNQGSWTSFDVPLSDYPDVDFSQVNQFMMNTGTASGTVFIDNIYFFSGEPVNEPTSVESTKDIEDNITLYTQNNELVFKSDKAVCVKVLNISGKTVYASNNAIESLNLNLSKGIYIVTAGTTARKIVVR